MTSGPRSRPRLEHLVRAVRKQTSIKHGSLTFYLFLLCLFEPAKNPSSNSRDFHHTPQRSSLSLSLSLASNSKPDSPDVLRDLLTQRLITLSRTYETPSDRMSLRMSSLDPNEPRAGKGKSKRPKLLSPAPILITVVQIVALVIDAESNAIGVSRRARNARSRIYNALDMV